MTRRSYSREQRAEAVALSTSIGPVRAARQLGIPTKTVVNWTHRADSSAIIAAAEVDIASALRAAHAETLASVLAGVRDPASRLGERATALRVLGEQLALAEGRATQNVEMHNSSAHDMTPEERVAVRDWIDKIEGATDDELREWLEAGGVNVLRHAGQVGRDQLQGERQETSDG